MSSHSRPAHRVEGGVSRRAPAGRLLAALVWALGYAAALAAANIATSRFGLVPAGFGLLVTAGTYTAGLALALRDGLHEAAGVRGVLAALAAGIAVSALTADPRIVVASTVAAAAGELADLAAYTPLRTRWRRTAVIVSGAVGGLVDTVGFLRLAGFGLTAQSVGGAGAGQGRLGDRRLPRPAGGAAACSTSATPAHRPSVRPSGSARSA